MVSDVFDSRYPILTSSTLECCLVFFSVSGACIIAKLFDCTLRKLNRHSVHFKIA
jgi:hypothetical protein